MRGIAGISSPARLFIVGAELFTLNVLGGASLEGPDGPLTGRAAQRHRLALLALLAAADRGMTRDKLIGFLWPEKSADRARHALSDSVYRINRALGDGTVEAVAGELRLHPGRLPSDLATFEEALEREEWQQAVDAYGARSSTASICRTRRPSSIGSTACGSGWPGATGTPWSR